jgi:hypothetical protein
MVHYGINVCSTLFVILKLLRTGMLPKCEGVLVKVAKLEQTLEPIMNQNRGNNLVL